MTIIKRVCNVPYVLSFLIALFLTFSTLVGKALGSDWMGSLSNINFDLIGQNFFILLFVFLFTFGLSRFFLWIGKKKPTHEVPLALWEEILYGKLWRTFLFLFILWSLIIAPLFPVTSGGDLSNQFEEVAGTFNMDYYWGVKPSEIYPIANWISQDSSTLLTNQHGFLLTFFYGGVLNFSYSQFGSLFVGMLVLGVSQMLLTTFAFSNAIHRFNQILPTKARRITFTLIIVLNPLVLFTLLYIAKVPLFAGGFVLTMTTVYFIIRNKGFQKWDSFRLFLGCFTMLLAVKWSLPIVILIFIWLAIRMIPSKKSSKKYTEDQLTNTNIKQSDVKSQYNLFFIAIPLLGVIAAPYIATATGLASADDKIESQTIQIQQIARLAKLKPEAINNQEREALNKIFNMDNIGDLYKPDISDPVKSTRFASQLNNPKKEGYRAKTVQPEDWEPFNKIWLDLYKKEPSIFNDAFAGKNIGYFDITSQPDKSGIGLSFMPLPKVPYPSEYHKEVHFTTQKFFWVWNNDIPIAKKLIHGPFFLALFLCLLPALLKTPFRYYVLFLPSIFNIAVLMISPVNGSTRYTLGFVYLFPILVGLLLVKTKKPVKYKEN